VKSSSAPRRNRQRDLKPVFLGAVALAVLAAAVALRQVLTPVVVALVIAYVADPLLSWSERHRVRRGVATTLLYTALLALVVLAAGTLGPKVGNQARRLYRTVSGLARDYGATMLGAQAESGSPPAEQQILDTDAPPGPASDEHAATEAGADEAEHSLLARIEEHLPRWGRRFRAYVETHADEFAARTAALAVTALQNTAQGLSSAASFVFGLILTLVFAFFFMLHFRNMVTTLGRYIPAAHRERTLRIVGRIDSVLSDFFRGRLLVCVIAGIVYVIGLRVSGIDYWLLIGLIGGILSFVPILGVILPLIPACAFALLTSHPWASLIGVAVTFSVVQWLVEPIAGTLILSRQVRMHPVTIILSLLIGGSLLGVFGLLLSVPVVAVLRILAEEFVLPPLRELADRERQPRGAAD